MIGSGIKEAQEELAKKVPVSSKEDKKTDKQAGPKSDQNPEAEAQEAAPSRMPKFPSLNFGDRESWTDTARELFGLKEKVYNTKQVRQSKVWKTAEDESGKTYYYNDNGDTTWEKPTGAKDKMEDEPVEEEVQDKEPETEDEIEAREQAEAAHLAELRANAAPSHEEAQLQEIVAAISALEETREQALADGDMQTYKQLNKDVRTKRKAIEKLQAKMNSTELVQVHTEKGAWEQFSEGLQNTPLLSDLLNSKVASGASKKFSDTAEDAREIWETSQNPLVYRMHSVYNNVFGETDMGEAIREIRKVDPNFSMESFQEGKGEDYI